MFGRRKKRINLALQGGGAHGAFTWGALDRLLEADAIDIGWISGTSAGALNAVAIASGLATSGNAEARATLTRVWHAVEASAGRDLARLNPFLYGMTKNAGLSGMAAFVSPYDFNPLRIDPLHQLLDKHIDFEGIRTKPGPELLIAATDVGTGRARLFKRAELTTEMVLASACLPHIHHAVEIEGRAYWDGGYAANPDLITLADDSPVQDTLLIRLTTADHSVAPRTARDITAHIATITFNQPLVHHLETIAMAQAEPRGWLPRPVGPIGRLARHRLHIIDAGPHTASLSAHSKASPEPSMLNALFNAGRHEASQWLDSQLRHVGRRQTLDVAQLLASPTQSLPTTSKRDANGQAQTTSEEEDINIPRL